MDWLRRAGMGMTMLTPLGWGVRLIRFGWRDAYRRLADNYAHLAPFCAAESPLAALHDPSLTPLLQTIPEIRFEELVPNAPLLKLSPLLPLTEGAMQSMDLLCLLGLVAAKRPKVLFEIGTFFGTTTAMMALNAPGAEIHTLDLPPDAKAADSLLPQDDIHLVQKRKVGEAFKLVPGARIIQHYGDSAAWNYSPIREATFVLIDGAHTYEYVRNDTLKCIEACGRPATIVWHDCDLYHRGVVTWLAEMVASGHPVKRIRGTAVAVMEVT